MATKTVTKGLIGKEDCSFADAGSDGTDTFTRSASGGATQSITKLHAVHIPIEDANSDITAENVNDALEEIALSMSSQQAVYTSAKGSDIASAATIDLGNGNELYFDITGSTNIKAITQTGVVSGRLVILKFDSACVLEKNNLLRLTGGSFYAQPGDHIILVNDNSVTWYELARTHKHDWQLHGDEDQDEGDGGAHGTHPTKPHTDPYGVSQDVPISIYPTSGDLDRAPYRLEGRLGASAHPDIFSTDGFGNEF